MVIVGNAMSRGNPAVEYMLTNKLRYTSGPQWLYDHLLKDKWALAIAGTHGKTSTSSMLAWILEYAGMNPGFLIGGIPKNFDISARIGDSKFFVIEADEYDTAFFDKRSKFVHYRPRTAVLNNLEFDHADIFEDISDIQMQFHNLIRTIPSNGLIIAPSGDSNISEVTDLGCWSDTEYMGKGKDWNFEFKDNSSSVFSVMHKGVTKGTVSWTQTGNHNARNGLAAIAAANHIGVEPNLSCEALCAFLGVKRRMEKILEIDHVTVYDDFAHHPTAISATLKGLRCRVVSDRIVAVIEPRSNTMKKGIFKNEMVEAVKLADEVLWYEPEEIDWSIKDVLDKSFNQIYISNDIDQLVYKALASISGPTHIVVMSNGAFQGLHTKLTKEIKRNFNNITFEEQ
jgi:UDP-N-acetylmuramate: L-alanyl-gamma-D-glutamyl-meso-diaminopimelate ligase